MKLLLPLLLAASNLTLSSCSQIADKWTAMQVKGVYRDNEGKYSLRVTDKKVIMSNNDKTMNITVAFTYEVEDKHMFLELASTGGLGSLLMAMGNTPEIEIADKNTLKYKVGSRTDIYKRVE